MTHRRMQEHYGLEGTFSSEDSKEKAQTYVTFRACTSTPDYLGTIYILPCVFVLPELWLWAQNKSNTPEEQKEREKKDWLEEEND